MLAGACTAAGRAPLPGRAARRRAGTKRTQWPAAAAAARRTPQLLLSHQLGRGAVRALSLPDEQPAVDAEALVGGDVVMMAVTAVPPFETARWPIRKLWGPWKTKYLKSYPTAAEDARRLGNFEVNVYRLCKGAGGVGLYNDILALNYTRCWVWIKANAADNP